MAKKSYTIQNSFGIAGGIVEDFFMARAKISAARALADQTAVLNALRHKGPLNFIQMLDTVQTRDRLSRALRALLDAGCIVIAPGTGYRPYKMVHPDYREGGKDGKIARTTPERVDRDQLGVALGEML